MERIASFNAPYPLSEVPAIAKSENVSFHDCSFGHFMAYVPSCILGDLEAYTDLLCKNGYEITAENTINDNKFVTLRNTNSNIRVHTYFIGSAGEIRVVAGERFVPMPEKAAYDKICSTVICQVNAAHNIPGLDDNTPIINFVEKYYK